jgi:hypothetical protein
MSLRSAWAPLIYPAQIKILFGHTIHELMAVPLVPANVPPLKPEFAEPIQELPDRMHRVTMAPRIDDSRIVPLAQCENRFVAGSREVAEGARLAVYDSRRIID